MILSTNRSLYGLVLSLVLLGLTEGCSSPFTSQEIELRVKNQTSHPLIFKAYDLESSHLVDPMPNFVVGENQMTLIQPDEAIAVSTEDVGGSYGLGNDLRFFLYTIRKDSAFFQTVADLTHEELEQYDFQVALKKGEEGLLVGSLLRD